MRVAVPRRRRRPGAAASAYAFALAVLRSGHPAEVVATTALRRGTHSRTAVLAHARHLALSRPEDVAATDHALPVPYDLRAVADALVGTRPPVERAVIDLQARHGLDVNSFAKTLGLSPERAEERATAVAATWADELDPAMLAWLGPGSCDGLGGILATHHLWPRSAEFPVVASIDSTGPVPIFPTGTEGVLATPAPSGSTVVTIGSLLDVAPVVRAHIRACATCTDRLRGLTPVRALTSQVPLPPVPPSVATAARAARHRLPTALPPAIEPKRFDLSRLRLPASAGLGIAAVALVAAAALSSLNREPSSDDVRAARVQQLLQAPPASQLLATPSVLTPGAQTAQIANVGPEPLSWRATTTAPWLTVSPSQGRLKPTQSISLNVTADPDRATSAVDAQIVVVGDDGSRQVIRFDPNGG